MCSTRMVEKFEFLSTQLRDYPFFASNFVIFYLTLIFAYPEYLICLASKNKKFEFWHPPFRGDPYCGTN